MTGWLIALAVLALLLFLKVGVHALWDGSEARLRLRVGLFRFSLSGGEKTEPKKTKKQEKNAVKTPSEAKKTASGTRLSTWLKAFWEQRGAVLQLLDRVLHAPKLELLRLSIAAGGVEPELTYGRVWAGLGVSLPALHRVFSIRKQELDVTCRYDLPKTQVRAEVEATVRVYELFALAFGGLGLLLKVYRTKKVTDKAVQAQ